MGNSPPRASASSPQTKKVCDVLVREKVLEPGRLEAVFSHIQKTGDRVEEAILALGLVPEANLLKTLAASYKAYFISTEKLAKAEISRAVLDMIPQRFAEASGICPVLFDAKTHTLTVVTADPDNTEQLREVQMASGAKELKPILARPAAIKALVAKAYGGDIHAFALLDRQAHMQFHAMLDAYEGNIINDGAVAVSAARSEAKARAREPMLSEKQMAQNAKAVDAGLATSSASTLELLNVLVSLLEGSRPDLRGHSAEVARLARRMAEKMGLEQPAMSALVAAAYVHDLGKMGQYHLTALNCAEYDGHKVAAQKGYSVPSRLLSPARMAGETIEALDHMYERFDGKGLPDGMSGKDIPLGARVLAICDTYADLTQNPRNPFRKTLPAQEACDAIAKHRGKIFDPNLTDLFRHVMLGEDLKARLLSSRSQALLIDTDPEESTVLELRMIEQGFIVKSARAADQAIFLLAKGEIDVVVAEVDLGKGPSDGLALLAQARKEPWGKNLPWVVYTRNQEPAVTHKAFELGVLDFVNKPANVDILVAKLKAMLDKRVDAKPNRGVSGSLREMGLPDMVQVLFHGRKSGKLKIHAAEGGDGEIHFNNGEVINALWADQRGEDAFYAMLKLEDGEFALDPSFKPGARVINQSAEALLLEGMRRLDEGLA
jgi:response regulator RpfG family c-di-GMP phosphodiesterase